MVDPVIDKATLEKIIAAANRQLELEKKLEDLDEEKKRLNAELTEVAGGWSNKDGKGYAVDGIIPTLLTEADVQQIVMNGGFVVTVSPELKIPSMDKEHDETRQKMVEWAEKSGNDGVIKDFINIPFGKGDLRLKAVLTLMATLQLEYYRNQSIHPGTLKSLFNEILATPKKPREDFASQEEYDRWMLKNDVPLDELGVQIYKRSKIQAPKAPKVKIK